MSRSTGISKRCRRHTHGCRVGCQQWQSAMQRRVVPVPAYITVAVMKSGYRRRPVRLDYPAPVWNRNIRGERVDVSPFGLGRSANDKSTALRLQQRRNGVIASRNASAPIRAGMVSDGQRVSRQLAVTDRVAQPALSFVRFCHGDKSTPVAADDDGISLCSPEAYTTAVAPQAKRPGPVESGATLAENVARQSSNFSFTTREQPLSSRHHAVAAQCTACVKDRVAGRAHRPQGRPGTCAGHHHPSTCREPGPWAWRGGDWLGLERTFIVVFHWHGHASQDVTVLAPKITWQNATNVPVLLVTAAHH